MARFLLRLQPEVAAQKPLRSALSFNRGKTKVGNPMADELLGKRIAFLATHGVEQVELTKPWQALEAAGADVELISIGEGDIKAMEHLDPGATFPVDTVVDEADVRDYDGLVLPGGVANPDALRANTDAVRFVRAFFECEKPVAAICHGPWTLIEADVVRGRTLTSWPSLKTDIQNAGGRWVDEEVHVEDGLVTSRKPSDLDAFCAQAIALFAGVDHSSRRKQPRSGSKSGTDSARAGNVGDFRLTLLGEPMACRAGGTSVSVATDFSFHNCDHSAAQRRALARPFASALCAWSSSSPASSRARSARSFSVVLSTVSLTPRR